MLHKSFWGVRVKFGIPEKKIKILGSLAHDSTFKKAKKGPKFEKKFVLLATGVATNINVNNYTVKANEEYEQALRLICQTISKAKKKLIIKIHPHVQSNLEEKIANEIDPSITVLKNADMASLIESCELMITLAMTTAILDAQIVDKPVFCIQIADEFESVDTFRPSPGLIIPITNFENTFKKILSDNNFRIQVIKEGKKFVDDCLTNHGNTAENIANFLKNYT